MSSSSVFCFCQVSTLSECLADFSETDWIVSHVEVAWLVFSWHELTTTAALQNRLPATSSNNDDLLLMLMLLLLMLMQLLLLLLLLLNYSRSTYLNINYPDSRSVGEIKWSSNFYLPEPWVILTEPLVTRVCPTSREHGRETLFCAEHLHGQDVRGDRGWSLQFSIKVIFVKSMIDALFMSTYTLNSLFVLIKYITPLIFRIVVK